MNMAAILHPIAALLATFGFSVTAPPAAPALPGIAAEAPAVSPPAEPASTANCPATPPSETQPAATQPADPGPRTADPEPRLTHPDPEVDAILDRIAAAAAEVDTLTADVRYDTVQELLGDMQRRFGRLEYKNGRPARFRLHLDRVIFDGGDSDELDQDYVFDGRWLLDLNTKEKIAKRREMLPEDSEQDLFELGRGPFALPLNQDKATMLERFDIVRAAIDADNADHEDVKNAVRLRLTPKEGVEVDADVIDLWYDRDTALPIRGRLTDKTGDTKTITLIEARTDGQLDAERFETALPTGRDWRNEVVPLGDRGPVWD